MLVRWLYTQYNVETDVVKLGRGKPCRMAGGLQGYLPADQVGPLLLGSRCTPEDEEYAPEITF